MKAFWLEFEPYLSNQVVSNVEPIVKENLTAFFDEFLFEEFSLGSKAPIIEAVKGYKKFQTDIVVIMKYF